MKTLLKITLTTFFLLFIFGAALANERLIKPEMIKQWMDSGKKFSLVDLRNKEAFADGHIPGAINIPAEEFTPKALKKLKARPIVFYCWSEGTSRMVARDVGRDDIFVLQDGIAGWQKLGYKIEKGR